MHQADSRIRLPFVVLGGRHHRGSDGHYTQLNVVVGRTSTKRIEADMLSLSTLQRV